MHSVAMRVIIITFCYHSRYIVHFVAVTIVVSVLIYYICKLYLGFAMF